MPSDDYNTLTLSSGKILQVNCGFVGLNPAFEISEGYDGPINKFEEESQWNETLTPEDSWTITRTEQIELCNIMLTRWQTFKNKLEKEN